MVIPIHFMATDDADTSLLPPERASEGAAGFDICANLSVPITLAPMARAIIPTGLRIELPDHTEAQIRPRSGLAIKHGITVINSPGTIDSDYRGEVKIGLVNLSDIPYELTHGMRIAQMVIAHVAIASWHPVTVFTQTDRDTGGFGSTGFTSP